MRNQKIIGTLFNGATFCVSFPKGFDCEPDILITGFEIYGDGDASAYVVMAACANWLIERSEIERSRGAKSDLSEVVGIIPSTISGYIPEYEVGDDDGFDSTIKALGGFTKAEMEAK